MKNGFNSKLNLENKGREGFILFWQELLIVFFYISAKYIN